MTYGSGQDRRERTGRERERIISEQEVRQRQAAGRADQALARKITGTVIVMTALNFAWAQFIVWGLATFGVNSGVQGVWLILTGLTSAGVAAIRIGMMRAVRDTRQAAGQDR
jgi:hypothetical protein